VHGRPFNNIAMKTAASSRLPFELDYLAALARAGLKPLSRWEGPHSNHAVRHLHRLGLRTAVAERTVATGRRVDELLISRSQQPLDVYLRQFDHRAVNRSPDTMRTEGLLFGYPVPAQPDVDGDGLTAAEEDRHGCDPILADTDGDGVLDGADLAYGLWEMIEALPVEEDPEGYRIDHWLRGLVHCPVCGVAVNMGTLEIVHPRRRLRQEISYLDLHGLQHGAVTRLDEPRLDLAQLEALLRPSVILSHSGGQLSLRWKAQPGRKTEVYRSDSPEGPWQPAASAHQEGADMVFTAEAPEASGFYKLVVR
jgi:hypothetical protein